MSATCEAGHRLIVRTKGTFWLTIHPDSGKVAKAVVAADAGDAGNLGRDLFAFWGCEESRCSVRVSDAAIAEAIAAADSSDWPLLHHDDSMFIEMEG